VSISLNAASTAQSITKSGGGGLSIILSTNDTLTLSANGTSLLEQTGTTFAFKGVNYYWFTSTTGSTARGDGITVEYSITPPSQVAAAGTKLDAIKFDAITATFTGTTTITNATGVNFIDVERPTYTCASGLSITNGATLVVKGTPINGGSVFIANAYAIWIQQGQSRFDGTVNVNNVVQGIGGSSVLTLQNASTADSAISLQLTIIDVIGTVQPHAAATYDLGTSSKYWANGWVGTANVHDIVQGFGGSSVLTIQNNSTPDCSISLQPGPLIDVVGSIDPHTHNTYNLGTTSKYWANSYVINMQTNVVNGIGSLTINTPSGGDISVATNNTQSFRIVSASASLIQIIAGLTPIGSVAVGITNAPAGVTSVPVEYWEVLGTNGHIRYIPLLGSGVG